MSDALEFLNSIASSLSATAKKPTIFTYQPHEVQKKFHENTSNGRLLAGSNRSGKTIGGGAEAVYRLRGQHPYQKVPEPPVFGRVITVDFNYGADQIIEPVLSQLIPRSDLIKGSWEESYNRRKHVLTLANGSKLEIKTHDQALESFAGTPRHFLWVDEECPKAIFIESKLRLIDYGGCYWITMTPVEGLTWVYSDLIENTSDNIEIFKINLTDNPYISKDAVKIIEEDLADETDKKIRIGGEFVPRGGLVFKEFNYNKHVIEPGMPPKFWTIYRSIDAGINNPTAVLWHAVSPDGFIITFFEHYRSDWTAEQHAKRILELDKELELTIFLTIGDPSMQQRSNQTGHSLIHAYRMHGIPIKPGQQLRGIAYIDKMNEYLRADRWKITKNCPNLIREMRKLPWKTYKSPKLADQSNKREEPLEKDDHACDSAGYFFMLMPDIRGQAIEGELLEPYVSKTEFKHEDYPWRIDPTTMFGSDRDDQIRDLEFGEIL